jgi:hypothetical protein
VVVGVLSRFLAAVAALYCEFSFRSQFHDHIRQHVHGQFSAHQMALGSANMFQKVLRQQRIHAIHDLANIKNLAIMSVMLIL